MLFYLYLHFIIFTIFFLYLILLVKVPIYNYLHPIFISKFFLIYLIQLVIVPINNYPLHSHLIKDYFNTI